MQVTIRGKRWNLRFCRMADPGDCDGPHIKGREIRINQKLRGRARLDTIIHEVLHAAHWDLGEEAVEATATDLARILHRLGYESCEE